MYICLINPPYAKSRDEGEEYNYSGFTLPHLGIGYIASVLEQAGNMVDILECMGENLSIKEVYNIVRRKYDVIGISVYEGNKRSAFKLFNYFEKIRYSGFVFAGGYTATLSAEQILRAYPYINCCVLGEGEHTVLQLVKNLENGCDFRTTAGIAYVESAEYIETKKRELIQNLDSLPFPKRKFMNPQRMISMITSRGCTGNCTYCAIIAHYRHCNGQLFRNRSAENIVAEIEYLTHTYGDIKSICFFDDNFLENTPLNNKKVLDLISIMKNQNMYIPFSITVCARDVIRQSAILAELKAVGLYKVFIGVESFVQRQLNDYNKRITVEENIKAINIIQEAGLEVSLGLILFDPDVNLGEIASNFSTLKRLNIKNAGKTPFSLHTYLIAVRGTTFMSKLLRDNAYIPNEKGYVFKNKIVEEIVACIKLWNKATVPLMQKSYLIEKTFDLGEVELNKKLEKTYNKFIELDIKYVMDLCVAAENEEELLAVYNKYCGIYQHIYDEYMQALEIDQVI